MNKLTLIDKTFFLKKTPLFRSLTLEMLLPIADKLMAVSFDQEDIIFDIGDEAHRMYFILAGQVKVQSKLLFTELILEAGAFFGDEALFNDHRRAYKATALIDCEMMTLSQTNLFTIISEYPTVALGFLGVYSSLLPNRAQLPLKES